MNDEMARRLAELQMQAHEVMGRFDARCEVLRTALEDLTHPMRVNALVKVLKEVLTEEEWEYLEWNCKKRGV